jgi:predicted PurR-regulated permease PerM
MTEAAPSSRDPAPGSPVSPVAELRRRALAVGFGIIALVLFTLLVVIYAPVARPILWAAALATLFFPLHRRILALVGGRARLAATISTVLTLAIFAVPAWLFVTRFITEVRDLWPAIRASMGSEAFQRIATWIDHSRLRPALVWVLPEQARLGPQGIEESLRQVVSGFSELAVSHVREIGRNVPGTAVGAGMTVVTYFFFLRHGPGWLAQLQRGLPLEPELAAHLLRLAGQTINAVFRGVVITAVVQAFLAGVGYAVAGAPVPVVMGTITLIAALIPFVGPVVIWLPIAVGLMLTGHMAAGVGLFLWGTLVVSLVDNTLRPWLIGRETKLPILWLFLAILGGLRAFGFLGLLLGPAVLALFLACYRVYSESRRPEVAGPPGSP